MSLALIVVLTYSGATMIRTLCSWRHAAVAVFIAACLFSIRACSTSPIGMLAPPDSSAWAQCGNATKVRLKPPESTITVAYTEPTTGTDGKPLQKLVKTTVYVDAGGGPMIAKVVPATNPGGGGKISQQVILSVQDSAEKEVAVCVTATDADNREGPATP